MNTPQTPVTPPVEVQVSPPESTPVGTESLDPAPPLRICTKCRTRYLLSLTHFYADKSCRTGLSPYCKTCSKAASKAAYLRYRQHMVEYRAHLSNPVTAPPDGFRVCDTCGVLKPLTHKYFHRHVTSRGGFHNVCKQCRNAVAKQRRVQQNAQFQTPPAFLAGLAQGKHQPSPSLDKISKVPITKISALDQQLASIVPESPDTVNF